MGQFVHERVLVLFGDAYRSQAHGGGRRPFGLCAFGREYADRHSFSDEAQGNPGHQILARSAGDDGVYPAEFLAPDGARSFVFVRVLGGRPADGGLAPPDNLDPDLLEERANLLLGYGRDDDLVILLPGRRGASDQR